MRSPAYRHARREVVPALSRFDAREPAPLPHLLKQVVDECVNSNTILRLSMESAEKGLDKVRVVLHFCRLSIEEAPATARKAVVLALTVPQIRQHFDAAEETPGLRARYVIWDSSIDAWERKEWQRVVKRSDLLLITPQLFLDALEAKHLWMSQFCAVAFDECQHCFGGHPFSKILSDYCAHEPEGAIRILGLSTQLAKRKLRGDTERKAAVKRLERALCGPVKEASDLLAEAEISERDPDADTRGHQVPLRRQPPPPSSQQGPSDSGHSRSIQGSDEDNAEARDEI